MSEKNHVAPKLKRTMTAGQMEMISRITILSNDLNSETSVSYASCENCVKNENYANSDPQGDFGTAFRSAESGGNVA